MRFISLASRNMKEIYRDPVSILLGVGMPAVLLILFISISKNIPAEIFTPVMLTPGVIVFSFAFLTMFSSQLLGKDRKSAFLTRLLASPLRSIDFILAYSLPFLPIALAQIGIIYSVGIFLGMPFNLNILISMIVLIPIAIVCIGMGMIMGSLLSLNQIAGIGSIVIVTISLFGGSWMDLKMFGGMFKSIGYALPFAHAIDAARAILKGADVGSISADIYWTIGYAVGFFILGVMSFQWKTKR